METSQILISIIIFVMIFSGIFTFINSNFANWGLNYENEDFAKIMQKIKENEEKQLERIQKLSSPSWIDRILSAFDTLFGGMWDIIRTTFIDTPAIISSLLTNFPIPIPGWFTTGIIAILTIILVSLGVYLIFKVKI
ncbi:MAG: hypothetical protein QXY70_02725 [Nanopusillaceae archaeon]